MVRLHIVQCLLRRKMIHSASFFGVCFLLSNGVFGDTDEVKSVSVMEGYSVTLNTDVTLLRDDQILWMFGPKEARIAEIYKQNIDMYDSNVIFDDRLQMDSQTGSLTIRNIRTEHAGLYKLQIFSERGNSYQRLNVTVYAALSVPVITRDFSQCSSSERSSGQNCSLLCSVVNVRHVSLSWYKGTSLLSSISASGLSISPSLPLEVEYQDNNNYSCIVNNPISNQSKHLNITDLCQPCSEWKKHSRLNISVFVIALLPVFIAVITGWRCYKICKQSKKEVKTQEEEVLYTETTFSAYRVKSADVVAAEQTEYSTVKTLGSN